MPRCSSTFLYSVRGRCCVPREARILIVRYSDLFWEPHDPKDEF